MVKIYTKIYHSSIGEIVMKSDGRYLTGLKFKESDEEIKETYENIAVLEKTINWLNRYFSGEKCYSNKIDLKLEGSEFQKKIWQLLQEIPYGMTTTYGEIAKQLEKLYDKRVSPQGVGKAIGKNPILIIIPCHRVIGSDGSLKGYVAGLEMKKKLLKIETFSK